MARGLTVTETKVAEFVVEECCTCGLEFAMTRRYERERRRDGAWWHCPNGHPQHYTEEQSKAEKLQAQLKQAQDDIAWWRTREAEEQAARERAERQRAAAKGQLTKALKRIQNGVCPHCNRHFVNVERHMANKHAVEPVAEDEA